MIVHLPKPSKKGPITCAFCSDEAASVCNSRTPSFIGCNRPFCSSHGIPYNTEFAELTQAPDNESHLGGLARHCMECFPRPKPSIFHQKHVVILLGVIWASFTLFFAFTSIWFLLMPAEVTCREGTLLRITNQKCMLIRNLTINKHVIWFTFQNQELTKCGIIPTYSRAESSISEQDEQALPDHIQIRCKCPRFKVGGRRIISNGRVVQDGACTVKECAPNGQSWLSFFGQCLTSSPRPNKPQSSEGCPRATYLNKELGACTLPTCPLQNYFLNQEETRCRMCSLFTFSEGFRRSCSRLKVWDKTNHFQLFEHPYKEIRRLEPCPEYEQLPRGARRPNREEGDSIYRPRVVDQFGYWQCPTRFEGRLNRTCLPEEMLIRYTIGCQSLCKPCLEKWDFALKKCVPADTHCKEVGQKLTTSGECINGSENQLRYMKEQFGESSC